MTNIAKNYTPEVMPKIEIEDSSAQIFLAFSIKWKNQEYYGTFIVFLTENLGRIDDYGIEWSDEAPDFGEFESYIYEEIEEKLLEEVLKQYNIH